MTERCDQLQRNLAQMELVTTQTQDILASYRDLDQMEAAQTEMSRQGSIAAPGSASKSLSRVTFAPLDSQSVSRRGSQASAENAAELRARIQAGARQMQAPPPQQSQQMKSVMSADLDAAEWADIGPITQRPALRQPRAKSPSPMPDVARRERQATMDKLRQPMPTMPPREFKFTTPPPIGDAPKMQRTATPFAAKDAGAAAFASTHGYPAPQAAKAPAKP